VPVFTLVPPSTQPPAFATLAMNAVFPPPTVPLEQLDATLARQGFALLDAAAVRRWLGLEAQALAALQPSWERLCPDHYLRDGGRYRKRRHSCFVVEGAQVRQVPHRVHWQPLQYNALHGGMQRWFEPIEPEVVAQPAWQRLLQQTAAAASALKGAQPWYVEAHQFRIDTTDGIGRPTPEGAHRDGMELVAVYLLGARASRAARAGCSRPTARRASASP